MATPRPAAAPDAVQLAGAGARRPLVSAQGRLAGFEFQVGAAMRGRLQGPAASAYTTNLLGAMRLCCSQSLGALAELPASWVAQGAQDRDLVRGMHLLLRADALFEDTEATCALISRLRRAGVRVGWSSRCTPAVPRAAGRPDFMPLPAPATPDAAAWQQAVQAAAERWPDMPLLLLELPAVDVMESLLGPPILWAACTLGGCSEPARAQALPPQAQRALRLLNRLLHDEDHAAVVDDIKADAALSLRLLQYMNSAGALPGRELDSIEQAARPSRACRPPRSRSAADPAAIAETRRARRSASGTARSTRRSPTRARAAAGRASRRTGRGSRAGRSRTKETIR